MFKFLKEKIQDWTEKIKEEFSEKEVEVKKTIKSKDKKAKKGEKKVKTKESKKPSKKIKEKTTKKEKIKEQEIVKQETAQEIVQEVKAEEEKPGFFSKLFSKKEDNKTAELVIEDIQKEGEKIESPEERYEEELKESEEKKSFFDKFKKKITLSGTADDLDRLAASLARGVRLRSAASGTLLQRHPAHDAPRAARACRPHRG